MTMKRGLILSENHVTPYFDDPNISVTYVNNTCIYVWQSIFVSYKVFQYEPIAEWQVIRK